MPARRQASTSRKSPLTSQTRRVRTREDFFVSLDLRARLALAGFHRHPLDTKSRTFLASMGNSRLRPGDGKDATNGEPRKHRSVPAQVAIQAVPSIVGVVVMLSLIFGGCCSNVQYPFNPGIAPDM